MRYAPTFRVVIHSPRGQPIASLGGLDRAGAARQVEHELRLGNRVRVWLVTQSGRRDATADFAVLESTEGRMR